MTAPPEIATAYMDEWGLVTPEVHQAAVALREQAENYARAILHNEETGRTLLAKAAAIVTRALTDQPGHITNLRAYLFQTYKRQVLAELQKEKARERILSERAGGKAVEERIDSEDLDQRLLIQELRQRMNPRTRQVFDLLSLGHTFEDIGLILTKSSRSVRNKYYEQLARLKKELRDELAKKNQY
jgi:DNA-directed RNA polymerase specialized sigma24 family protein